VDYTIEFYCKELVLILAHSSKSLKNNYYTFPTIVLKV